MIDGPVNAADGVQTDLDRSIDGKLDVTDGEPFLAIRATEGVHPDADPLKSSRQFFQQRLRFL